MTDVVYFGGPDGILNGSSEASLYSRLSAQSPRAGRHLCEFHPPFAFCVPLKIAPYVCCLTIKDKEESFWIFLYACLFVFKLLILKVDCIQ